MNVTPEKLQTEQLLKDLLAVMHRDGGHHAFAVGLEQAVEDAKEVYFAFRDASDKLKLQAEQKPAGIYSVSNFRRCESMQNTEFQPMIDFSEGQHKLYAAPPDLADKVAELEYKLHSAETGWKQAAQACAVLQGKRDELEGETK